MDTVSEEGRRRGFERFLLFTDAVTAIAVTLLILPVVDAAVSLESHDRTVMDLLNDLQGEILGFLLSFTVIMALWMAHQRAFSLAIAPSAWLLRLNMLWLLSITLLPFTTALIADHGDEQATVLLYVGNVALSMYCLAGSVWVLARNPHLLMPGGTITVDHRIAMAINCALITIAFILVAILPGLGFSVMLLLILAEPLQRWWKRRRTT